MKVVFVSSEIVPFASTGGLGDVAAALPKSLAVRGVKVIRMMPLYGKINREKFRLKPCGFKVHVPLGNVWYSGDVWMQEFEEVCTYFIDSQEFFSRSELYGVGGHGYADNFERFLFFQKAVVRLIDKLALEPDIVHCNDWQTGLIPMLLYYGIDGGMRDRREKTLYTVHNLAYQGWAPAEKFYMTALPGHCYTMHTLEYYGEINCMKGGLVESTAINTVSPTYAKEVQTDEFGSGLQGVMRSRRRVLHGILNGIDYNRWNPQTDPHIAANYSVTDLAGKAECKRFLQEEAGLKLNPKVPLMGMITRLAPQKGIDIIAGAIEHIVESGAELVILGSGDTVYENMCREWMQRWPDKVRVWIEFSSARAHQIEAGADLFLMPSQFEPCGQNQLFSMRYGTLPLVHGVGGLEDTVVDAEDKGACGFKFYGFNPANFSATLDRALTLYSSNPDAWKRLIQTAMQKDFSGLKMADDYIALYQSLLEP